MLRIISRSAKPTRYGQVLLTRFNSSQSSSSTTPTNTVPSAKPTYRVNDASHYPEDAADATSTVLADALDFQKRIQAKDRVTWWEILENQKKRKQLGKVSDSFTIDDVKTTSITEKTRADGFSYLTLPFKNDMFLRDFYINPAGRLRFGHLFQDLDALAGRVAAQHCEPSEPMNVTASIDRIYLTKKVDEIHKYDFVIVGYVTYTGRSSMEICIKGFSYENNTPKEITPSITDTDASNCFLSANFTFVARNPRTHKSHAINKILPTNEKEWIDYKRAESHNASKKLRAKLESLDKVPPTAEESSMIHNLYNSSKILSRLSPKPNNIRFMKDSAISATQIQQPQYRNRHGIIFGGYLLRQTFELAYCTAGAFAKSNPRFISLDNVTFKAPVPVGCVLLANSEVCYTEHIHNPKDEPSPSVATLGTVLKDYDTAANELSKDKHEYFSVPGTLVQVKVDTKIRKLNDDEDNLVESGTFVYSFYVPRDGNGEFDNPGYHSVIPESYSEMMDYVEGRRRAYETSNYAQQLKLSE